MLTSLFLPILTASRLRITSRHLSLFPRGRFAVRVENNPDFKSVWQLAHIWIGEEPPQAISSTLSPQLRLAIDRLMRAISSGEISARYKNYRIFDSDSFWSIIFDSRHIVKFYIWFVHNKHSKNYLDNLYVKRNEVISWCEKIALITPPPCWHLATIHAIATSEETEDENSNWHVELTDDRRKKTGCLELAKKLWEENPELSYEQIYDHPIMKKYGNHSIFSKESFKKWAKEYASEYARKGGRRKKSK